MKTSKKTEIMKLKNLFGIFLLLFPLFLTACDEETEKESGQPRVTWEYESLMCEGYDANGENPYIIEGEEHPVNYPLGKLITRDEMGGEENIKICFGDDGILYTFVSGWRKESSYRIEGKNLILDEGCTFFFPMNQEAPPGFGASTVTHEILEWTDKRISIREVQTDASTGTRLIFTNNFRRAVSE